MNLRTLLSASICGAALSVSVATAQQAQQNQQQQNQAQQNQQGQQRNAQQGQQGLQGQSGQRTQWQTADQAIANCIAIGNQEEIALARFAQNKAENKDVKEFAQMMIKDHQNFLQKLQRYAPQASQEGFLTDRGDDRGNAGNNQRRSEGATQAGGANRQATGQVQQTAGTNNQNQNANQNQNQNAASQTGQQGQGQQGQQGQHQVDIVQLHKEIAEECLSEAKQRLNKKDGQEFDEAFMGLQMAQHGAMKAKLTVFQRHAAGELGQILSEGLQTTEKHMQRAEEILKKLDNSSSSDSKRSSDQKRSS